MAEGKVAEAKLLAEGEEGSQKEGARERRPSDFVDHPFLNSTPKVTLYEGIKMTIMTILLIPLIRVLLVLITVLILAVWTSIFAAFTKRPDPETGLPRPFSRPVRRFMWVGTCLARLTYFWMGVYWIRERYVGKNPPRVLRSKFRRCITYCCWFGGGNSIMRSEECPRVVVSSHVSFFDGLYYGSKYLAGVVMKAGIARAPVCGRIINLLNPLLVPRTEAEKKKLPSVVDQLIRRTNGDPKLFDPVLVFPEATTINQKFMIQFQKGAFLPLATVQPVCLRFPFRFFDMSWTPGFPTVFMFYRAMCQFYLPMEVLYLDPIEPPKPEELEGVDFMLLQGGRPVYLPRPPVEPVEGGASPGTRHVEEVTIRYTNEREKDTLLSELFAAKTRDIMAAAAGCEKAPYSERDGFLWKHGLARGFGQYVLRKIITSVQVKEIERVGRVNWRLLAAIMTRFHELDVERNGIVTKAQFLGGFSDEQQQRAKRLFSIMDTHNRDFVDFRDVALTTAAVLQERGAQRMAEIAFAFLDQNADFTVSFDSLVDVLTQHSDKPSEEVRRQLTEAFADVGLQIQTMLKWEQFAALAKKHFSLVVAGPLRVMHVYLGAKPDQHFYSNPKDLKTWAEADIGASKSPSAGETKQA